ncbi:F-box/LRR-repeat protein 6 [Synchiropus splendidus]|uniref:F-box/LRR-repeat protein 6 n=1 Tax=Synchiropus splendidus TaxID=270530 RepID=UPI00237E581A|nr:F-box/LRR-repeat protein 6 [Synchiropus splendidus]
MDTTAPGGRGSSAGSSRAAPRKRPSDKPKKKAKKRRRTTFGGPVRPAETSYQVGGRLLVFVGEDPAMDRPYRPPKKKTSKKRKSVTKKPPSTEKQALTLTEPEEDFGWGQHFPEHLLVRTFKMVVDQEGAVPFLCRVGRVCRLWNSAASNPVLWKSVSLGHVCVAPGKRHSDQVSKKQMTTVKWLVENRFSLLREFSLNHWIKDVDNVVVAVSTGCVHLRSLCLSFCKGLTRLLFKTLAESCRHLESLNLKHSEFPIQDLLNYLSNHGQQLKQLMFTNTRKNFKILHAISKGVCPNLEWLDINSEIADKDLVVPVYIQKLQAACPNLRTFKMLNGTHIFKGSDAKLESGFPELEELCLATAYLSFTTDQDLIHTLFGSTKLLVLDLRGCSEITAFGLSHLPCLGLECLYWGQYCTMRMSSTIEGLHLLTKKWRKTLRELDIENLRFSEEELEEALHQLTLTKRLQSLNLSGTRVTPATLRNFVGQMTNLNYLNLTSCRNLPRGVKRSYQGQDDIRGLLGKLE